LLKREAGFFKGFFIVLCEEGFEVFYVDVSGAGFRRWGFDPLFAYYFTYFVI